ncbi:MAG: signal peptidase I [Treponema sp.]|nr:signal peptidase I [Treponema sp.]
MFNKLSTYSYREQKNKKYRLLRIFIFILILYIAYNCFTTFFFSVWVVENNTMSPGLNEGDRLVFSSFNPPWNINKENAIPFNRGSIVLVDMKHGMSQNMPLQILDGIVRFFTAQRISIFSVREQYYIKRIIALPGDEISMENYVFRVKASGSLFSLTEFELSDKPYHTSIPQVPDIWNGSIPFSGSMDTIILKADECFVISDDRSNTNDSRTWGAVLPSQITARAVLRFWPLNRFEIF